MSRLQNISLVTVLNKATGGGSKGQKTCWIIFKDLIEQSEMQKTASKNIIPSEYHDIK